MIVGRSSVPRRYYNRDDGIMGFGMNIEDIGAMVLVIAVAGIIIAFSGLILDDLQDETTTDSVAYNATGSALDAVGTFGDWLPTVALAVLFAIIVGIVLKFIGGAAGRQ